MGNHFIPFVLGDLQSPSQVTSGYAIRAGRRPAAILPVDSEIHRDKPKGRKHINGNNHGKSLYPLCPRGFAIPEVSN